MIEYSKTCIRACENMRRSPEVLRLMRVLKISMPEAVGIMVCLAWLMLEHAGLKVHDANDIADGIGWRGDPDMLHNTLHEARILCTKDDPSKGGTIIRLMPKLGDYKLQDGC